MMRGKGSAKECIGSGRARHHHHHHHHRGVVDDSSRSSAIDELLPVASVLDGTWKSRRKIHRTPRRLATLVPAQEQTQDAVVDASGTLLCIAGDEYICVANTVSTPLLVYRLTQTRAETRVTPWATVSWLDDDDNNNATTSSTESSSSSAIVSLQALPFGHSLIYGETCRRNEEGLIVAFSDDGQGFILRIRRNDCVTKLCTFQTQNFGVTCAAVVPSTAGEDDKHLLVGYQTGYMESWKIFRFSSEKILAKLLWRGLYSQGIQNMASLTMEPANVDDGNAEGTESSRYLLVTVRSLSLLTKTNAMVQVLDLKSIPDEWKRRRDGEQQQQGHLRAVNLDGRFWIMPAAGMELLNSSSLSSNSSHQQPDEGLPRRAHVVPSASTGSICALPQATCVALADGTVAMFTSTTGEGSTSEEELRWGIANDYNQLLLTYPAIGSATLNWDASQHAAKYIPHVACCLRAGSTYLIPFVNPDDADNSLPVTVFSLDNMETHSRYIHGFTAGNLILSPPGGNDAGPESSRDANNSDSTTMTTPVLVYGWAGGIIDVYSCELHNIAMTTCRPMMTQREVDALEELVSNGSYNLLTELMESIKDGNSSNDNDNSQLLQRPLWKECWKECQERKGTQSGDVTAALLLTPEFAATRALLLNLSTIPQEDASR